MRLDGNASPRADPLDHKEAVAKQAKNSANPLLATPQDANKGQSSNDPKAPVQNAPDGDSQAFFDPRQFSKISISETSEKITYHEDQLMTSVGGDNFFEAVTAEDRKTVATATKDGIPGKYSIEAYGRSNAEPESASVSQVFGEAAQLVGPLLQLGATALISPFRMLGDGNDAALDPALGNRATQAREDDQDDQQSV